MSDIRELETFLTLPHREGEIRCSLKDAGNGPAIDLRVYGPAWKKRGGRWEQLPPSAGLRPTKAGVWISLEPAEQLADVLAPAVIRGYELRTSGGYPADGGPPEAERRPDWNCPDCGTDNISEARNCGRCGARKRVGVLA